MPVYDFPLEGAKQLNKKLIALGPRIAKKVIRQSIRPAAKLIQREARRIVLKDTRALEKSIKLRAMKRSRTRIGIMIATNRSDNFFLGKTFYGGFLEFGFRRGKRTSAQRKPGYKGPDHRAIVPAQPFMRPAYESKRDQAGQMIVDNLRAGIEREASK